MKPTAQEIWRAEHTLALSRLDDLEPYESFIVITWSPQMRPMVNLSVATKGSVEMLQAIEALVCQLQLEKEE